MHPNRPYIHLSSGARNVVILGVADIPPGVSRWPVASSPQWALDHVAMACPSAEFRTILGDPIHEHLAEFWFAAISNDDYEQLFPLNGVQWPVLHRFVYSVGQDVVGIVAVFDLIYVPAERLAEIPHWCSGDSVDLATAHCRKSGNPEPPFVLTMLSRAAMVTKFIGVRICDLEKVFGPMRIEPRKQLDQQLMSMMQASPPKRDALARGDGYRSLPIPDLGKRCPRCHRTVGGPQPCALCNPSAIPAWATANRQDVQTDPLFMYVEMTPAPMPQPTTLLLEMDPNLPGPKPGPFMVFGVDIEKRKAEIRAALYVQRATQVMRSNDTRTDTPDPAQPKRDMLEPVERQAWAAELARLQTEARAKEKLTHYVDPEFDSWE